MLVPYAHWPPAAAQADGVSPGSTPQGRASHLPLRHIALSSQGHPQNVPGARLPNACSKAAAYRSESLSLIASSVHPSHAAAGQEGTSPTATQSLSTLQDWSYWEAMTMEHDAESGAPASPGDASALPVASTVTLASSVEPASCVARASGAELRGAPPSCTGPASKPRSARPPHATPSAAARAT